MGDGASDAMRAFVRGGIDLPRRPPSKPTVCDQCNKVLYGLGGLMQHQNAKHGAKHTWSAIVRAEDAGA